MALLSSGAVGQTFQARDKIPHGRAVLDKTLLFPPDGHNVYVDAHGLGLESNKQEGVSESPSARDSAERVDASHPRAPLSQDVERGQAAEAERAVSRAVALQRVEQGSMLYGSVPKEQALRESDNVRRLLQVDGELAWRPDPQSLPPQLPAGASMEQLLAAVPPNATAFLAFGNSGVTEMLLNWVSHMLRLRLGRSMLVAAFDDELVGVLRARRIPTYNYSGALPSTHFRHAPYLFHRMGYLKAVLIAQVLRTGRHVLVSDSDVAWVRDPTAEMEAVAATSATLAASTDCIDVAADADKQPRPASPHMCGHAPNNTHGAVFNTGILWFRSTSLAIDFAEEWALSTLQLTSAWSDDQGVFNRLITRNLYPVQAASADGRIISAGALRVLPLPADRFCSGHLVWVQQEAQPRQCLAVHATFTEYGDAGKKWRFLEANLWGILPKEYYSEGRYLTFNPPAAGTDPAPCAEREGHYVAGSLPQSCGGEDPDHGLPPKAAGNIMWQEGLRRSRRLQANVKLMEAQVHALRDALALARVLNRTLVLPHFEALCDRSELPEIIPSCIYPGAPPRMRVPFKASTHFVTDTHKLQMMAEPAAFGMRSSKFGGRVTSPLRLRAHSFLHDARTSEAIRGARTLVRVRQRDSVTKGNALDGAGEAVLVAGATDREVLEGLHAFREQRVLVLENAQGAFSGWEADDAQAQLFNTMMQYYLLRGAWCCTWQGGNQDNGRVYLTPPPALTLRGRPL